MRTDFPIMTRLKTTKNPEQLFEERTYCLLIYFFKAEVGYTLGTGIFAINMCTTLSNF